MCCLVQGVFVLLHDLFLAYGKADKQNPLRKRFWGLSGTL